MFVLNVSLHSLLNQAFMCRICVLLGFCSGLSPWRCLSASADGKCRVSLTVLKCILFPSLFFFYPRMPHQSYKESVCICVRLNTDNRQVLLPFLSHLTSRWPWWLWTFTNTDNPHLFVFAFFSRKKKYQPPVFAFYHWQVPVCCFNLTLPVNSSSIRYYCDQYIHFPS